MLTNEQQTARRQERKRNGLCTRCGKKREDEFYICKECRDKHNAWCKKPDVYQRRSEQQSKWAKSEKAKPVLNRRDKKYYDKVREDVFEHYGKSCACCGEHRNEFLTIDHINGGGNKHRKEIFGKQEGGKRFWAWLRSSKFPDGYQTLCYNCNIAKHIYGECPHQANADCNAALNIGSRAAVTKPMFAHQCVPGAVESLAL